MSSTISTNGSAEDASAVLPEVEQARARFRDAQTADANLEAKLQPKLDQLPSKTEAVKKAKEEAKAARAEADNLKVAAEIAEANAKAKEKLATKMENDFKVWAFDNCFQGLVDGRNTKNEFKEAAFVLLETKDRAWAEDLGMLEALIGQRKASLSSFSSLLPRGNRRHSKSAEEESSLVSKHPKSSNNNFSLPKKRSHEDGHSKVKKVKTMHDAPSEYGEPSQTTSSKSNQKDKAKSDAPSKSNKAKGPSKGPSKITANQNVSSKSSKAEEVAPPTGEAASRQSYNDLSLASKAQAIGPTSASISKRLAVSKKRPKTTREKTLYLASHC